MTGTPRDNGTVVALCARIYALLLMAYPANFRRDYGPQMAQAFRDCCRDTHRQYGPCGLIALWVSALGDLAANACIERLARVASMLLSDRQRKETFAMAATNTLSAAVTNTAGASVARRRVTIVADITICLASLISLLVAGSSLYQATAPWLSGVPRYLLSAGLPGAAWLAFVGALAWRGRTLGQTVLGLRWVDSTGDQAHWRPMGEAQFWCTALPGLILAGCSLALGLSVASTWALWHLSHTHVNWSGGEVNVPIAIAVIVGIAVISRLVRRCPARLVRHTRSVDADVG